MTPPDNAFAPHTATGSVTSFANGFTTVFAKECLDNIRDKRTIISSFSLAFLGPALFVGLMAFMLNTALGESDDPLEFAIVGGANAPTLVSYLAAENTIITELDTDDPVGAVRNGDHALILVIPDDYSARYARGEINALPLVYDSSDLGGARRDFGRARFLITRYSRTVGLLRLQLRGVDPTIAEPIRIQEVDTASPAARALSILATLPYLMILVIFMGGFYLAIDTTAGEREHGSLEPLLTQPIDRATLVLGKIAATSLFGAVALMLFLVSFAIALPFVPLERIGMSLTVTPLTCLAIFLSALPLIIFAAAMLTVVASFAKSYKEAQTYLTIVILVPTLPLIITQLLNVESSLLLMAVPSLAQSMLISDLIAGEPLIAAQVVISYLATGTAAALMAWLAIVLYRRERILL